MAGQFFTAIDAELTGAAVAPAAPRPTSAAVSSTTAPAGHEPAAAAPTVFAGRAGVPPAPSGDAQTLLLGAVGGAVLTLVGVLVGYRLGRAR
jgi:hypothetical protein